jgi:hypothetical protein
MTLDLAGVGIGPFNLSLAALAEPVEGLHTEFFERAPEFRWHPGLMVEGAALQVPFLADLVSLVEPAHPLSFLSYLRDAQHAASAGAATRSSSTSSPAAWCGRATSCSASAPSRCCPSRWNTLPASGSCTPPTT